MIVALGNPATADSAIGQALGRTNLVHFASLSAFDAADPDDAQAAPDPRLVFELSLDGEADRGLLRIVEEAGPLIEPIFRHIAGSGTRPLAELLHAHKTRLHFFPWGATGLNFNGTPDCPVGDIEQQRKVSTFVRDALDRFLRAHDGVHKRAMDVLTYVRSLTLPYETLQSASTSPSDAAGAAAEAALRGDGAALRPFLIRPAGRRLAMSEWTGHGNSVGWPALLRSTVGLYGLLLVIAAVSLNSAAIHVVVGTTPWITPALLVVWGVATAALLIATFVANGLARIGEAWNRIVTILVYLGIPLGGVVALAVVVGGVVVASEAASRILQDWFPGLAASVRWVLAVACGVIVTAVVLRALAAIVPLLWKYRRPLALVIAGIAALAVACFLWLHLGVLALTVTGGLLASFLLFVAVAGIFLAILYWHELRDVPDERTAPLDSIARIAAKENPPGYVQNHITAVTPLKPGAFRKLTLAVSLWGIGKLVQYWFRPGFVLNMGTIHYARWFRLPGSEMLVFFSNYDGSWQSYLEDFVTKAHNGQSAAWSNGRGFPRTILLVLEGAKDGDRFKRWVRRQQIVTQLWYSRFPDLTTDQIRTNALIHDGLMRAQTDTAARAWLDCIGTMPRPDNALESDEVQSIVFRGLPAYRYTLCAALALPEDRAQRRAWLDLLGRQVRFGEHPDLSQRIATFVGFSARGIARCLDCHDRPEDAERVMSTFPSAFRLGMANRAAILGDRGTSAPDGWRWTDADTAEGSARTADVMIFIYGRTIEDCRQTLDRHYAVLKPAATWEVTTQPTEKTLEAEADIRSRGEHGAAPMYRAFRFPRRHFPAGDPRQPARRGDWIQRRPGRRRRIDPGLQERRGLRGAGGDRAGGTRPGRRSGNRYAGLRIALSALRRLAGLRVARLRPQRNLHGGPPAGAGYRRVQRLPRGPETGAGELSRHPGSRWRPDHRRLDRRQDDGALADRRLAHPRAARRQRPPAARRRRTTTSVSRPTTRRGCAAPSARTSAGPTRAAAWRPMIRSKALSRSVTACCGAVGPIPAPRAIRRNAACCSSPSAPTSSASSSSCSNPGSARPPSMGSPTNPIRSQGRHRAAAARTTSRSRRRPAPSR